jgi:hypothetical protein
VAFSPKADLLASAGEDGTVQLWNLDASPRGAPLQGHRGSVHSVAFSPKGDLLATAGVGGTVLLWNLDGSPEVRPLQGVTWMTYSVAFSPKGDLLASAGYDGTLRLWNTTDGTLTGQVPVPSTRQLLWQASRLYVTGDSEIVSFEPGSWTAKAILYLDQSSGLVITDAGWFASTGPLVDQVRGFRDMEAPIPSEELFRRFDQAEALAAMTGKHSWLGETSKWGRRQAKSAWSWYKERIWAWFATLPFLYSLICLFLWLFQPAWVCSWAMDRRVEGPAPPWKWLAEILDLIRWLGNTRRAVRAWWAHEVESRNWQFRTTKEVKLRQSYVDIGNAADAAAFVKQWTERATDLRPRWIFGPGGYGKSTLAIRMAISVTGEAAKPDSPVRRWPSAPVLVSKNWEGELIDHLRGLLAPEGRLLTPQMLEHIEKHNAVIVVLDGLSERGKGDGEDQIKKLREKIQFRNLIITARSEPTSDGFETVRVGPLAEDRLDDFLEVYVNEAELRGEIRQALDAFLQGVNGGAKSMPALLAWIAIDLGRRGQHIPQNYADLVERYVQTLHPSDRIRQDDFFRSAMLAARDCVETTSGRLKAVESSYLRGILKQAASETAFRDGVGSELNDTIVFDLLTTAGLLKQDLRMGTTLVEFQYDPVAEYLAAMHYSRKKIEGIEPPESTGFARALQHVRERIERGAPNSP